MLGKREPGIYGSFTLEELYKQLELLAKELSIKVDFFQSNHEGALIDKIESIKDAGPGGILVNPGAYGHTSIALRDALLTWGKPFVEVHITNVYKRESFRHTSYLSDIASGVVVGFGMDSYRLGLRGLAQILQV
jgi:3-dehydroquinate dehydratase II